MAVVGCSRTPLPAVKNAMGGAARNNFYPWQSKNLYRHRTIMTDSIHVKNGFSAQPLCTGDQQILVPANAGGIVEISNDSLGWYVHALHGGDSSSVNALAADSLGNCYATTQHTLFSLTSAGALRWSDSLSSYSDGAASLSPPLVLNSHVYCCSVDGALTCADADGNILWTKNIAHPMLTQIAALANGNIVVVYSRGDFHETDSLALYDAGGNLQWVRQHPAYVSLAAEMSQVQAAIKEFSSPVRAIPPIRGWGRYAHLQVRGRRSFCPNWELLPQGYPPIWWETRM